MLVVFGHRTHAASGYDQRVDADYYSQAGALFRLMLPAQQRLIISDIVAAMRGVTRRDIQLRQIAHFFKADCAYGKGVAEGLGPSAEELRAVGA